ncbi:MAG: hypothetical protein LH491_03865 [Pseudoxanthomonas sp.]|nr:hypothetical protein [Pseudoxanthomonas sp.]
MGAHFVTMMAALAGASLLSSCTGPTGPAGPAGPAGISGYEIVVAQTDANPSASKQLRADCPPGKQVLGAGWSVLDNTDAILDGTATYFEPSFDGTHWLTNARNNSAFAAEWKLRVRLICAGVAT